MTAKFFIDGLAADFQLSEFNINYDFKNPDHVELLKKQIEAGAKLEIVCYEEDSKLKIIDGGHSYEAYMSLGLDPKEHAKIIVEKFQSPADLLAFSRHRNVARLQQEPTRYTKSLFQELKLRLEAKTDQEARSILRRYYNLKEYHGKYKPTDVDNNNVIIIDRVFLSEPVKPESFVSNHLPYLNFPSWLADMVDNGQLTPGHATAINTLEEAS